MPTKYIYFSLIHFVKFLHKILETPFIATKKLFMFLTFSCASNYCQYIMGIKIPSVHTHTVSPSGMGCMPCSQALIPHIKACKETHNGPAVELQRMFPPPTSRTNLIMGYKKNIFSFAYLADTLSKATSKASSQNNLVP